MSKNLEELSEIRKNNELGSRKKIFYHIICVLENIEERLKTVESELGIYTKEEIKKLKVGGTDPD